jgi:hypothetical protein
MLTGDVPFHGENQVSVAMKHVREDFPDVSKRRPEVSAGLAAVLDRMTCKDLRKRYPDALSLQADLEDALARELSRTGHSTGEATAVLRTLPEGARRRLPLRMRRPLPIVAVVALIAAAAALGVVVLKEGVDRTQRGTGQGTVKPEPGTKVVSVKRTSARDFDPAGDGEEHRSEAQLAVDKEPGTDWTTEGYTGATLGDKEGVGIYVDADPGVAARSLAIDTPEPGWQAEIRVADGNSPPKEIGGWQKVAGGEVDAKRKRFRLRGDRHRYYLVWITGLAPGAERVKIAEITLFAPKGT